MESIGLDNVMSDADPKLREYMNRADIPFKNISLGEYSVYSQCPSEVTVEMERSETMTASSVDVDELGDLLRTALSGSNETVLSCRLATSDMKVATALSSSYDLTTAKEMGLVTFTDLRNEDDEDSLVEVDSRYSWYSMPRSEAECEIPFTFKVGKATVVDSNEMILMNLHDAPLQPVEFVGDKYLYGVESSEANVSAHKVASSTSFTEGFEV